MSGPIHVAFCAGRTGPWRIDRLQAVAGPALPSAPALEVVEGGTRPSQTGAAWTLRGVTSFARYTRESEQAALAAVQPPLGRPAATRAALIPVSKSGAWWDLPQDRRRALFEERSRHIATGLGYLPAIARRLYHGREAGETFDFLTWFEFAPEHAARFEELVAILRSTVEWSYVEREVDIRLSRDEA